MRTAATALEATSGVVRIARHGRRLRVALLTNEIPPYRVPLYAALARTPGWELRVFTCVRREVGRRWEVSDEQPFSIARSFSFSYLRQLPGHDLGGSLPGRTQVHLPLGLPADLWRYRPDAIISAEFGLRTLIASSYARLRRIPLWIYCESTPHTERHVSRMQRLIRGRLCAFGHRFLCNGRESRCYLEQIGVPPAAITEIGQALDVTPFAARSDAAQRQETAQRLRLSGMVFLYVGYHNARKGLRRLLDAWAEFSRGEGVGATLVLAGDGPDRALLEEKVRQSGLTNVRFPGFFQFEQLPAIYHAADVFVLPTLEDCWGLVVNEAMAAGLPVIGSPYAGSTADLIVDGVNGWIADPFDPGALVDRLRAACNAHAQGRLPAMGQAAQRSVGRMDVPQVAQRIRHALGEVLPQALCEAPGV